MAYVTVADSDNVSVCNVMDATVIDLPVVKFHQLPL